MGILKIQQDVAILYYAILGKSADIETCEYFAKGLETLAYNQEFLANKIFNSADGHYRYDTLSTSEKINKIYKNITQVEPTDAILADLVAQVNSGKNLGQITLSIINNINSYDSTNPAIIAQQQNITNIINSTLYPAFELSYSQPSAAEKIQGIYYVLGSFMDADGINYWGKQLSEGKRDAVEIADLFISSKSWLSSLSDGDFVKKIFKQTFGTDASDHDLQKYTAGLTGHFETRGDVVMRMIADIKNDTSHAVAKTNFINATHVYAPGELPELKYQEMVAYIYLNTAHFSADARAMDTYSKMLFSGTTTSELLKILYTSPSFFSAKDFDILFKSLYGSSLSPMERQSLLDQTGNDPFKVSALILETFRNGKSPFPNNHKAPSESTLLHQELSIAKMLGYKSIAVLQNTSDSDGLISNINTGVTHTLTKAEKSILEKVSIEVYNNKEINLDYAKKLTDVTLLGEFSASPVVIDSLKNKPFTLHVQIGDHQSFQSVKNINFDSESDTVAFNDIYHNTIKNAVLNIDFGSGTNKLFWNGNGKNGNPNIVSTQFTAESKSIANYGQLSLISGNFITKDIYLTTNQDGSISGYIQSNINQFKYFQYIELSSYIGTGRIYLDGKLVGNEGKNIIDLGVTNQTASIYNKEYDNVTSLVQSDHATVSSAGWTGSKGVILSSVAKDVHVINAASDGTFLLDVRGHATSQSKIHLELAPGIQPTAYNNWKINISGANLKQLNAGAVELTSHYSSPDSKEGLEIVSGGSAVNSLVLSGEHNYIERIYITGSSKLNLKIKSDFSDTLKNISIPATEDPWSSVPKISVNLTLEKEGTGGGEFYKLLQSLSNHSKYDALIGELAGEQITINYNSKNTFNIKGDTTLKYYDETGVDYIHELNRFNFEQSTIDKMVTITGLDPTDTVTVGKGTQQWVFSKAGAKSMENYGSVTSQDAIDAIFNSLSQSSTDNAQTTFGKVLEKITQGESNGNLAEVGALKLGSNLYVIIDKNHNQNFDHDDYVFSLGNHDINATIASTHYQSPEIALNGLTAGINEIIVA